MKIARRSLVFLSCFSCFIVFCLGEGVDDVEGVISPRELLCFTSEGFLCLRDSSSLNGSSDHLRGEIKECSYSTGKRTASTCEPTKLTDSLRRRRRRRYLKHREAAKYFCFNLLMICNIFKTKQKWR